MYAGARHAKSDPLDNCVAFRDYTKVKMRRLGGLGKNHCSIYLCHKTFKYLTYQKLNTLDGLMFYLYDHEVGRRKYMILNRESGLDDRL